MPSNQIANVLAEVTSNPASNEVIKYIILWFDNLSFFALNISEAIPITKALTSGGISQITVVTWIPYCITCIKKDPSKATASPSNKPNEVAANITGNPEKAILPFIPGSGIETNERTTYSAVSIP